MAIASQSSEAQRKREENDQTHISDDDFMEGQDREREPNQKIQPIRGDREEDTAASNPSPPPGLQGGRQNGKEDVSLSTLFKATQTSETEVRSGIKN